MSYAQFFLSLTKFQTRMLVLNTNIRGDKRGKGIGQMCQAIQDSVLLFLCCDCSFAFGSRGQQNGGSTLQDSITRLLITKFPDNLR